MADKRKRLSRSDWLQRALEVLREEGITGIRVEPLARSLGVTTGSFYWHFKNRADLRNSLLEHWENGLAVATPEELSQCDGDAREQFLELMKFVIREDRNRYDRAMRVWAASDESAAATVRRVDKRRLDTVRRLFLEMGFDAEAADLRSRISYYYYLGEITALDETPRDVRLRLAELRGELLAANAPGSREAR